MPRFVNALGSNAVALEHGDGVSRSINEIYQLNELDLSRYRSVS